MQEMRGGGGSGHKGQSGQGSPGLAGQSGQERGGHEAGTCTGHSVTHLCPSSGSSWVPEGSLALRVKERNPNQVSSRRPSLYS